MSQSLDLHEEVASQLFAAYSSKDAVTPPRESIDKLDLAGAYRIQRWQQQAFEQQGHQVIGHKIGLTSLAMQKQLGVNSPDFGFFTDQMLLDGSQPIDSSRFIAPKVEPELAFRVNTDLPADASLDEVRSAIDEVYLAVEIIDSRVANWDIKLVDTVADNASCGAIVLGNAIDVDLEKLTDVEAKMALNGTAAGEGKGSDVMGDPLLPLQWLVNTLSQQGSGIKAGSVVLTGSFCGAIAFAPGDKLDVDYGQYGTLSLSFS